MIAPRPGKVYLVGAGPGDPGLITVKGCRLLREADVVVYDRLGAPAHLRECAARAELIFVGKAPGAEAMDQEAINRLLIARAREGKTVVRLKGGDPFVFGRGGEEARALAAAGIPFEVVPGVTSAVGVPAYAGIPLTHRGIASSVAIVSGRIGRPGWARVARAADTIVILMGAARIGEITACLAEEGLSPDTPAAVVACGTLPEQRTVVGTLGDIAARAAAAGMPTPAVIVVGEVVRLREEIAWYERLPLAGRRVLVTRAPGQAGALGDLLAAAGAEPVEIPLIEVVAPEDWGPVDAAIGRLETYDWVVFTSANGVEFFFRRLGDLGRDARALGRARLACVGEATARSLGGHGLRADLVPESFRADALLGPLAERAGEGARLLLPRGDLARRDFPAALRQRGLEVDEVVVYRTRPAREGGERIRRLLEEGRLDVLTFASPSAVESFMAAVGPDAAELARGAVVACIGPVTAQAARERGLEVQVLAEPSTMPGLVSALEAFFAARAGSDTDTQGIGG